MGKPKQLYWFHLWLSYSLKLFAICSTSSKSNDRLIMVRIIGRMCEINVNMMGTNEISLQWNDRATLTQLWQTSSFHTQIHKVGLCKFYVLVWYISIETYFSTCKQLNLTLKTAEQAIDSTICSTHLLQSANVLSITIPIQRMLF